MLYHREQLPEKKPRKPQGIPQRSSLFLISNGLNRTKERRVSKWKKYIELKHENEILMLQLMVEVCLWFCIEPEQMIQKNRADEFKIPRQVCQYLGYQYTKLVTKEIAVMTGVKDHTTVINANKRMHERLDLYTDSVTDCIDMLVFKYDLKKNEDIKLSLNSIDL
jgi:chromosomal replication initiation ATPase DnaA